MRIPRFLVKALLASVLLVNCTNSNELDTPNQQAELDEVNKKEVAFKFIDLMKNQDFMNKTVSMLEAQQPSVALSKILDETKSIVGNEEAYKSLSTQTTTLEERANADLAPEKIEILEVWMHNPKKKLDFSKVLFSFAPEGEEKNWSTVEAYTIDKKLVLLDAKKAPEQAVIVIETNGFETLKKEVAYMNKYLQEEGVQNERLTKSNMDFSPVSPRNSGLETTKLDKIRLNNDEEPWISGAAEVYAITSGIKDAANKPEIKVIPMYYLDHDGTDYYPNQILLFWDDYKYQAANIQLFEKDDNVNYKSLVSTIVSGVFQIIGTVATQPWVNVLGQVAGAIIQAMPDQWYTNNDDYVDSFYTIEKNKNYNNHYGARGNARVNLSPFFVASN
ncbi:MULTISPECIES: DUF3103 family protein [unclassified Tenacibaculum]|uniref:DUF3103 family protein n=1 Tax=unclassified Tenacibaculum TaxID=2635139 RepID=UPI001F19B826|nr:MULTISPECIES: DUF3103 family protein [unclassified Tenacibaculum]MCF2873464.1 DUF3103 domain-containing protein [Tenacibaculum sp. Cn5-1]MCF2933620.1 DUF3103 domain-containing protein [Tenacibaculum sp. Cn5-34]MCG7509798.1 DUF3103 domain-containing protein [Tenacibaculum sp. Cn5-46]